jgi:hypothetical protein
MDDLTRWVLFEKFGEALHVPPRGVTERVMQSFTRRSKVSIRHELEGCVSCGRQFSPAPQYCHDLAPAPAVWRGSGFHLLGTHNRVVAIQQLQVDYIVHTLDPNSCQVRIVQDVKGSQQRLGLLVRDTSDVVRAGHDSIVAATDDLRSRARSRDDEAFRVGRSSWSAGAYWTEE